MRRLNLFCLSSLVIACVFAPAPANAQVPGEAQNVNWCAGSKDCLQWTPTPAAAQYRVYRGEQASMACLVGAPLDSCLESIFAGPTTGTGSIPEIPAPGRFYWFIVTAQNGTGEGPSGSVKQGALVQPRVRNTFGSCPANCTAAPGSCLGASDCCSSNCAGSCQTACCAPTGAICGQPADCCSNLCSGGLCQPCAALGQACVSSASCCSGNCSGNLCVAACLPNGDLCASNSQCCSGACALGSCQPGCTPAGGTCAVGSQCCSGVCQFSTCLQPTCSDGVKNGSETGVDCGGGTCPACGIGQGCNVASDCLSQTCAGGVCQCGPVGAPCTSASQCCGGLCTGNVCATVCGDGIISGTEQCDQGGGNVTNGDGCSSTCTVEPGFLCTGVPSVCVACPPGFSNCNGNSQDGCEVQVSSDPNNCGACNSVCALPNATSSCVAGSCTVASCNPGYFNCNAQAIDGCEVNVATSPANCGGCGTVCSPNNIPSTSCSGGVCNGACATGFADCNANKQVDGCEVNVATSPANCGGCGLVCSSNHIPSPTCGGGLCNGACAIGFGDCNNNKQADGCETALNTNSNCGACGNACVIGAFCIGGSCQIP